MTSQIDRQAGRRYFHLLDVRDLRVVDVVEVRSNLQLVTSRIGSAVQQCVVLRSDNHVVAASTNNAIRSGSCADRVVSATACEGICSRSTNKGCRAACESGHIKPFSLTSQIDRQAGCRHFQLLDVRDLRVVDVVEIRSNLQ